MTKEVPPVLFKYRQFSPRTLQLLCRDLVFYADPSTFNDPLDTKPCVEADCDVPTLQRTVYELVRRRIEAEMKAGARAVKYRGPRRLPTLTSTVERRRSAHSTRWRTMPRTLSTLRRRRALTETSWPTRLSASCCCNTTEESCHWPSATTVR